MDFAPGFSIGPDKFTSIPMEEIQEYEKSLHLSARFGCCDRVGFNGFSSREDNP
jgi:hypothetical protein